MTGSAIEVRLYAEDATDGFLPATGTLRAFELPTDVRVDSGFESGSVVSPYYDAMLAKVIAHAPTRRESAAALSSALRRARIHGVTTNRDLLVRVLDHSEFLDGATDTAFLERNDPAELGASLLDPAGEQLHALAAALAVQAVNRAQAPVLGQLPSGWRNNPSQPQRVVLGAADRETTVTYSLDRASRLTEAVVDGEMVEASVVSATPDDVLLTVDGVLRRCRVAVGADAVDVDSALGSSSYVVVPRFPETDSDVTAGSLVAPMPGSVVRVLIESGATVEVGQSLVVLEAMKMEHTVAAPVAGVVTDVRVQAGQQVEAGTVLVVVEEATDAD
jgi:acetyl/propionyl-CoA carboxylase alpha subunit